MSAAGTPSTDPWVILARERARYEEQFKSLKPINGVVTGEQAKGFFLQSQLPPMILGQIWALADTDSDGKMDINEFSIACKLINLKLRGFDIPKMLPPSLVASLKPSQPPAIPPLPNPALMSHPPARPEPPKPAPQVGAVPPMGAVPLVGMVPPVGAAAPIGGPMGAQQGIPTGVVPPMPSSIPPIQQPLIGIPPLSTAPPSIQPLTSQPATFGAPLVPGLSTSAPLPTMGVAPTAPLVSGIAPASVTPIVPSQMSPVGAVQPVAATGTPRGNVTSVVSGTSLDRAGSIESVPQADWSVPHQTKLKYTQIFNSTDRTRTGYLSGAQARNVMVQTKLPQNLLAQIWALSDMDADGRLGCEEFVLAMHLCEQAAMGSPIPTKLPLDLIPPSFRRTARTASVSSQGSAAPDQDPASTLFQTTFEDKRKENFEKGQAELERRRKTLLDQQRKEAEERERKEREELERKEKARQEAERKRLEELEMQMREQQEKERLMEEERKRQAEQREAARKEMERQRQLEWEKQRLQELQQQRQREQENVLKLKAKNQSLTIELSTLNDQVKELSQKICDTRVGVSNVKSTIDGMRSTRDAQMAEMSQLKNRLKDQNAKLLALSQEKVKLETKNKMNQQLTGQDAEQQRIAYENKEVTIKNLKEKIADMQNEIDGKMSDITNNNTQLTELRTQMQALINECEKLYAVYEMKRDKVLEMKNKPVDYDNAWKTDSPAWGDTNTSNDWPADTWGDSGATTETINADAIPGLHKYKAIYEFVARNADEISFQPGDIINVPEQQTGEPGWLAGEIRGHTGWFPEAYVEPLDGIGIGVASTVPATTAFTPTESIVPESEKLEGISEVPETTNDTVASEVTAVSAPVATTTQLEGEPEYYIANYPYQSQEPGDLTFNAGDVIAVYKKDGDWWTGKFGENIGIFPSNYVQKVDVNTAAPAAPAPATNETDATAEATAASPVSTGVSPEAVKSALESAQMDNEVSQINEAKAEKTPTEKEAPNAGQVMKGKKPEIASVIAPYQATSSEQLSLARGQLIMIRKKTDSGWWEGELQAKGRKRQVGWFPASYVKVLNSSGKISGRTTPVSTTRMQQEVVIDKVVALYPYVAGNPDELSFAKDDIISVTAREEEAWWRGELNGVSGLFPSNYVTPLQQSFSGIDKKRYGCINELIQTEQAYVHDMSIVHEVFETPLRQTKIILTKEIDEIFVNWRDILQVNKNFLNDLMNANSGCDNIGGIICKHLPLMTAYITFCGKQLDSANLLQKLTENSTAFRELVRKCQNNVQTKGMPLSSFLIKPMQRITRYPLLISKILENTPRNHPDYKNLEEAHRIAVKFLSCVNENVRLREDEERMGWLQQCVQNDLNLMFNSNTNKLGPRQLYHYGTLTKLKNGKELLGFLFNDFFMLVQPSKSTQFSFQRNSNVTYKMYKQPILIQNLSISRESTENVEQGTDSNRVLKLQDDKSGYKISLLASTVLDCTTWSKKIEHAKEMYTKIDNLNRQNKRKTQLHLGPTVGRLLVLVQKGKRLVTAVLPAGRLLVVAIVGASELQVVCNPQTCGLARRKGKYHTENVYCKVTLGNQEQLTDIAKDSCSNGNMPQNGAPQVPTLIWNYSMQFQLRNVNEECLTFTVLEQNPFSPDEFLGKAELKLKDIYLESQNRNGPLTKKLILHQVESGEIVIKLDLHMFNNY